MTTFLQRLREADETRQQEWDPGGHASNTDWRYVELGGEVGEVLNILKKLHREACGVIGSRSTPEELGKELSDVYICADLCAMELVEPVWRIESYLASARKHHTAIKAYSLLKLGQELFKATARLMVDHDASSIAMIILIVDEIAARYDINLEKSIAWKFNTTSANNGLTTRLNPD